MTPVQEGWHPSVEGKKLQHAGEGVHVHVCAHACMCVHIHVCAHVRVRAHKCTCVRMLLWVCVRIHVCECVCVCMQMKQLTVTPKEAPLNSSASSNLLR